MLSELASDETFWERLRKGYRLERVIAIMKMANCLLSQETSIDSANVHGCRITP